MRKRILALLLAAVMTLTLAPAAVAAEAAGEDAVAEYEAMADERRDAILSSPTEIVKSDEYIPGETYTGQAYYVSSSMGNDGNTGTSPDSPWQSTVPLSNVELQPGDAVFFKRGDIWREMLFSTPGVTYSAYGEGPKPVFTASQEEGADPGKWELYYQGDDGRQIWKFIYDLYMIGGIYLNGPDLEAGRVYGYWVGDKYVELDYDYDPAIIPDNSSGWTLQVGDELRPETSLDDLEFCCMPDLSGREYPIDLLSDTTLGPLYMRCDAGNPGEVYDSIEFCGYYWSIAVTSDCVFDNLAVHYWSLFAFWGHSERDRNVIIQNCEVAYGRQNVIGFNQPEIDRAGAYVTIDAIYGVAQDAVIRNNYVHDIDGTGITFESYDGRPEGGEDGPLTGISFTCTGNLIERCGACIQLNDGNDWYDFDKITISDNIAADAGYNYGTKSMGVNSFSPFADLSLGVWGPFLAEDLEVSHNVFIRSRRYVALFGYESVYQTDKDVSIHDNVYIQYQDGIFGPYNYPDWVYPASEPNLLDLLQEFTHGENETIIIIPSDQAQPVRKT